MNNKGQFYIIAALMVLVVIIATVITTYTALRYDSISDQPQVLSAVDETNLALKQLLGFTVGYYGSILRVTGNTSYAQNLAKLYLQSGLENVADIKPEWGLSLNISDVDLHVEWFLPMSNSSGQLTISYNLPGLGFYNLTCTIHNILNVEVLSSDESDEARISIHKEDDEPVTILSKNNFKFYHFDSTNQTWEPVSPTIEPVVFANGTYLFDVPPGVSTTSYMVQVKDNRGISVVASSCSRYVVTLNWTIGGGEAHYVDNDSSDVDSSANKGSHSNFVAQQTEPDSSYDTLTEVNTSGGDTDTELIDDESFEITFPPAGWSRTSSYWQKSSSGQGYDGSYSAYFDGGYYRSGELTTPTLDCSDADVICVDFWYKDAGCEAGEFLLQYYDGYHWDSVSGGDLGAYQYTSGWLHYQQNITDSQYFRSNFRIRIRMNTNSYGDDAYVDLFTVIKMTSSSNYELDLEEQWTNVNMTNPLQKLCIKTGTLGTESLKVDVWDNNSSSWVNLINGLAANKWNNVSVDQYLSENFTIRFKGTSDTSDHTRSSWDIDAMLLQPQSGLGDVLSAQKDSTVAVEWLQNGTMRVLGQNLQLSTEIPIPPIAAKGFHMKQIIDGVDQEVPFQIEDWASEYRIPLGLTNNVTVFSNRQMFVFLLSRNVTQVTLWWNGSDLAVQTPLAYVNTCFNDNPSARTLNNDRISLQFDSDFNPVTSTVVGSGNYSTANFMRINGENSLYGSELAYVITNGVVRDVVLQEAEWNDGAGTTNNCPNLYANIVLTLPAETSFYTYQLRLMFTDSQLDRTITDLCPVRLSSSISTIQTENGTIDDVVTGTGTFSNYAFGSGGWTAHHWSQFVSGSSGAGILFTDTSNILLYAFDSIAGNPTGALRTDSSSKLIGLYPVYLSTVNSFTSAMDITWKGAIATFDSPSTPVYYLNDGEPAGLWILAEYQPLITLTTET